MDLSKKLYRSRDERILFGVCGGVGNYFAVDPVLIRVLWVLLTFFYGAGLLAYIVCGLIIPEGPEKAKPIRRKPRGRTKKK